MTHDELITVDEPAETAAADPASAGAGEEPAAAVAAAPAHAGSDGGVRVLFVYERIGLGSAEIRGRQIAAALGADACRFTELEPTRTGGYDVVVYVKRVPPRAVMEAVRRTGPRQVLDLLDNFKWRKVRRVADLVDAFIGANHTHAALLESRFGRPAVRIPHHHCNFDDARVPADREPPTLGYVGDSDHWPETRKSLRGTPHRLVSLLDGETRQQLVDAYRRIDIGVSYRKNPDKARYNSAVKLVNFMSFGIPAVLSVETGYLEVGLHGRTCLFARDAPEVRLLVDRLARDPVWRREMGMAAVEAARPYHVRAVAELYRSFLESLA
ncbi:MAG TPA: hypothetical protein VJ957_09955 [Longimicrobiales bacterium]|nr:hypothetical protein [Longimicrobiales bacterium]